MSTPDEARKLADEMRSPLQSKGAYAALAEMAAQCGRGATCIERLAAQVERLTAERDDILAHRKYGCACVTDDDGAKITSWCALHAPYRDRATTAEAERDAARLDRDLEWTKRDNERVATAEAERDGLRELLREAATALRVAWMEQAIAQGMLPRCQCGAYNDTPHEAHCLIARIDAALRGEHNKEKDNA